MEKHRKELLITLVLIAVFIFLFVSAVMKKVKKAKKETTTQEKITKETAVSKPSESIPEKKLPWGRDPFTRGYQRPTGTPETAQFSLTAILWEKEKPLAIINGEVLGLNQEIGGYRLIKINKDNVIFQKDNQELTVELYK